LATQAGSNAIIWSDLGLDPVALDLGFFELRWYSLAYLAGIFLGYWYLLKLIKQPGSPMARRHADDLVFYAALGIILGGRVGYVLFYNLSYYLEKPLDILKLWDGGMSFHGGLIGVSLAIIWFANRNRVNLLSLGDLVAPVVPIGLGFGRLANFINGELWGRETSLPWGVNFCSQRAREIYGQTCQFVADNGSVVGPGDVARHPSQLYEAGLEGIVLFGILWLAVHKAKLLAKPGYVSGIFLFGYGLVRASLENVRQPDAGLENLPLGLTMGMILSIPMMLIGAWLIWRAWSRPPAPSAG
jgi:phosphatidylglycerol:prolipoprotein diacylglycerol transferase